MAMKVIRIVALVAALLVGGAAIASAQGAAQQGGQGRRNMQLDGIELTDAQKSKLDEIQKKYQPEMMALRDEIRNGGDRAELMKKGSALRDKSSAEIRAILTPDQQVVFDKHTAEMKARMEQAQRQAPQR
jgi:Spy/CpxP family protein refolding chaperone